MASFIEILFIGHILGVIGITLAKFYNVMTKGELYDFKMTWVLFVSFMIFWFMGLLVVLTDYTFIYSLIFKFTSLFMIINILFLIIELFFLTEEIANKGTQAYFSNQSNLRR